MNNLDNFVISSRGQRISLGRDLESFDMTPTNEESEG